MGKNPLEPANYFCSFCSKSRKEVKILIQRSKEINICNECVVVCMEIIVDKVYDDIGDKNSQEQKPVLSDED